MKWLCMIGIHSWEMIFPEYAWYSNVWKCRRCPKSKSEYAGPGA